MQKNGGVVGSAHGCGRVKGTDEGGIRKYLALVERKLEAIDRLRTPVDGLVGTRCTPHKVGGIMGNLTTRTWEDEAG